VAALRCHLPCNALAAGSRMLLKDLQRMWPSEITAATAGRYAWLYRSKDCTQSRRSLHLIVHEAG
ncbi:MAG: hypothetical protein WAM90_14800, partial [Rhodanobacter sp.]